jgi:hypothetical protein
MLRKLLVLLVFGLAAGTAAAHGTPPQHGGVVREAGDLSFELVAKGDSATLYVLDHGKPLATAGMSGKLTVLNGKDKTEADLAPAGDNRLDAKVRIDKGARAVAVLTTAQKKTLTLRFTVK